MHSIGFQEKDREELKKQREKNLLLNEMKLRKKSKVKKTKNTNFFQLRCGSYSKRSNVYEHMLVSYLPRFQIFVSFILLLLLHVVFRLLNGLYVYCFQHSILI